MVTRLTFTRLKVHTVSGARSGWKAGHNESANFLWGPLVECLACLGTAILGCVRLGRVPLGTAALDGCVEVTQPTSKAWDRPEENGIRWRLRCGGPGRAMSRQLLGSWRFWKERR
jgi:hypothetical protein